MITSLRTHPAAYVTIGELALYLAVSSRQVRKWIRAGQLETVKLSTRQLRVTRVSAWALEQQLTRLPPQPLE